MCQEISFPAVHCNDPFLDANTPSEERGGSWKTAFSPVSLPSTSLISRSHDRALLCYLHYFRSTGAAELGSGGDDTCAYWDFCKTAERTMRI